MTLIFTLILAYAFLLSGWETFRQLSHAEPRSDAIALSFGAMLISALALGGMLTA